MVKLLLQHDPGPYHILYRRTEKKMYRTKRRMTEKSLIHDAILHCWDLDSKCGTESEKIIDLLIKWNPVFAHDTNRSGYIPLSYLIHIYDENMNSMMTMHIENESDDTSMGESEDNDGESEDNDGESEDNDGESEDNDGESEDNYESEDNDVSMGNLEENYDIGVDGITIYQQEEMHPVEKLYQLEIKLKHFILITNFYGLFDQYGVTNRVNW